MTKLKVFVEFNLARVSTVGSPKLYTCKAFISCTIYEIAVTYVYTGTKIIGLLVIHCAIVMSHKTIFV